MAKKSILDTDVAGKTVFVRADFNVPTADANRITDDRRITAALPTIRHILKRGGAVVAASHFGRPAGTGFEPEQSLQPVYERLRELLKGEAEVLFAGKVPTDDEASAAVRALKPGQVLLLENLRFEKGEKKGDAGFAGKLAAHGSVYVNDAFGASHRNDASMVALPNAMKPKPCVAGLLLQKELQFLGHALEQPKHPFVAIVGGAKVSDKLSALSNLLTRVDSIIVGGAMAYTFLRAQGVATGASLVEAAMVDKAREVLAQAQSAGKRIVLPTDHVCGRELKPGTETMTCTGAIPEGWMGLDIGPASRAEFARAIAASKQVVWNGPMGAFETKPFDAGTRAVADAVVAATEAGAITIAGGGDTAAALEVAGLADRLTHVSTGGGASLEMLEGRKFDSVGALDDAS
ncbi:MAG: phosphoglycerate kinase [Phycisphaerae bacterium]|nr:phosphoglycerate kinase [Phycisphaerae bacterium]